MLQKLTAFTKTVAGLPDVPSPAMSALELKQWFDTAPEEMRVAFNALIDALKATTTGDSGAEAIGVEPIVGISATNVQNALEQLKLLLNDATAGAIPDGSLGPAKLNFDPATQAELDAHNADSVKHVPYALATGTANTYVATLTPAPTSYTRGMAISVEINVLNTGASTINVSSLGAKTIKKSNGNDVSAGQLKVGMIYTLRYNGTNFILQGEGGEYGTAGAGQVVTGYTVGTDVGVVNGTFTSDATVTAADILNSKIGYGANGARLTGTLVQGLPDAEGTGTSSSTNFNVTGLSFQPRYIIIYLQSTLGDNLYKRKAVWSPNNQLNDYEFGTTTTISTGTVATHISSVIITPTANGFNSSDWSVANATMTWYAFG